MSGWGEGILHSSTESFLLIRRNKDGHLEGISFTGGIIHRMDITPNEWKPLDKTVSEDI